ncbi:DUF3883 domain-containing protein [Brevundimonas sp. TWP2-3-4b2]|uniref:DUF3883 domain-containing protein n=1 Tax=Brevundimonas sp. TWP2-3-4b2 TaxID=2804595 RepID=UPI003CF32B7A
MTIPPEPRIDWTDWQNDLIVADYFDMFGRLLAGEKINRLERNRELQTLTARTKGSIERKRMNISGVLDGLDMEWMEGFAPNDHFQIPLADAVQRYLDRHPEWLDDTVAAKLIDVDMHLSEDSPPPLGPPPAPPKAAMERIARKYNHAERDYQNRRLGYLGEKLVYHREKRLLTEAGSKFAEKVEWTSQEKGDGVGYDILSFSTDGEPRKIEVKTTNGSKTTPFFLTRTERAVCEEEPDIWRLYRLHDLDKTPGIFCIQPPLESFVRLTADTWRATF